MATTLSQAFKLAKEKGLSTRDAIAQVEGNAGTQTTPVTPVTPAQPVAGTPQTPTQNFPSQPIDQQTVSGVNGEQFKVAPMQQQGAVQPTQPVVPQQTAQPTPEVKPTVTPAQKIQPQVDFNLSQGREGEIQKNVADITSTNPTLLKDRNAYNQAFGYETADQGKKALLDSAFQSGQPQTPNADMMFSSILMKAPVPDDQKTTTQYKIAQNRYLKASSYASMTPSQLSSDITSGKLIEGSQTYEDIKSMNPKLVQDTNNLRIVNGSKVSLYSTDAKGNKVNNVEQSFTEDYLGNFGTFLKSLFTVQTPEEIRANIYTDDVKQAQDKATEIELEMNQIEADQAKMEEITRKELEGTGASAERIRLEIGIRQDKLTNQYNSKLKEYNTYANKANNLITQNTTVYQEQMKQKTAQQQALAGAAGQVFTNELSQQNQIAQEDRAMQNALTLDQKQFDQKIAQQAEQMGTPELAIPEVINQYASLGVMATKSAQEHIANAKAFIAQGGTLGEYISQMQKDFQAKDAYKAKFAPQAKPTAEWKEIGKNADGTPRYGFVDSSTQTVAPYISPTGAATGDLRYLADQFPGQAWAKNNNPAGITWNANFDKGTGTAKLFADAGIQFSKGTARPANEGGNYVTFATIEDGLKAQQILMTQTYGESSVGDMLAKWVGTSEGPAYAKQVAGMAGITDLKQKVSALSPEQVSSLQMAKIKKESPGLYGILSQPSQPTSQYTDQNIADLAYLVELQDKNPTQASKDMKELGYTARDIANYKAGNVPLTDKQKVTSKGVVDDIKDLVSNYDWNDATGVHFGMPVIAGTDRADTLQKIDQLVAKMTLPNLGSLKGPMSDKDLAFITKASSNLSAELSDVQFEKNLVQAYNVAARRAGLPEVTTLDEIKGNTPVKQTVGGEKSYSKYE